VRPIEHFELDDFCSRQVGTPAILIDLDAVVVEDCVTKLEVGRPDLKGIAHAASDYESNRDHHCPSHRRDDSPQIHVGPPY
jgi:hypothetical protein